MSCFHLRFLKVSFCIRTSEDDTRTDQISPRSVRPVLAFLPKWTRVSLWEEEVLSFTTSSPGSPPHSLLRVHCSSAASLARSLARDGRQIPVTGASDSSRFTRIMPEMEKGRAPENKRSRKPAHPVKRDVNEDMKVSESFNSFLCLRAGFPNQTTRSAD